MQYAQIQRKREKKKQSGLCVREGERMQWMHLSSNGQRKRDKARDDWFNSEHKVSVREEWQITWPTQGQQALVMQRANTGSRSEEAGRTLSVIHPGEVSIAKQSFTFIFHSDSHTRCPLEGEWKQLRGHESRGRKWGWERQREREEEGRRSTQQYLSNEVCCCCFCGRQSSESFDWGQLHERQPDTHTHIRI